MVECIFTIDYEIYGNGEGSLRDQVYAPAQRLLEIFRSWDARLVAFVEVAELERIDECRTDDAIDEVKSQIREFHRLGFEIALHLHPQWYRARYENGRWLLDYSEYNLCTLPRERIESIVDRALNYLRTVLEKPGFVPMSFRAGNWLFQPTHTAAAVLAEKGIKVDSSVFKGGLQHQHALDYRPALRNGYFWWFQDDANIPDPEGTMLEVPTYTTMVPFWRMFTAKRVGLQKKSRASTPTRRLTRLRDYLRPWYPLKFDFCRMTVDEMTSMVGKVIEEDRANPEVYRPLVAIGHTKDLFDFAAVERFLSYLQANGIPTSTFHDVYAKCQKSLRGISGDALHTNAIARVG
jgi:hypothetical protein